MIHIRPAELADLPYLQSLDVKSFDDAWDEADWASRLLQNGTYVFTLHQVPVAFAAFDHWNDDDACLLKIAVASNYRRCQIATRLLLECEMHLLNMGYRYVRLYAHDSRLDPRRDDDLSGWLTHNGFEPLEIHRPSQHWTFMKVIEWFAI